MDLRLLEIFCQVYETRGFTRAAEKLRLRQPTVSSHIHALEEQVGTRLFDRRGRTVRPTRAAEILYAHGRQILDLKKSAGVSLDRLLRRFEGDLDIGGSTIPGEFVLPPIVAQFRAEHPGASVRLRIADTGGILENLEQGTIELAFVGAKLGARALHFRRFTGDELVLVARADAKWRKTRGLSSRDLAGLPFVLREPGSGTRAVIERLLKPHGVDLTEMNVVAQIGSSNGVKEAVKAGVGVTILSRRAVAFELEHGLLVRLALSDCPRLERDFFVVTDRRRKLSFLAESFQSHALKAVAES